MTYRSRSAIALAVLAAFTLTACGSDHGAHSSGADSTESPTPTIPADASFAAADVEFAQGMIPHHQQAIEMADIAEMQALLGS